MSDPFDAWQYISHLRARWRLAAVVTASALAVALAAGLLVGKQYTATVTLVIEPPAGSDPRASTAVSPIYLELLKTYEHLAGSGHLFAQAAERFQLRRDDPGQAIEALQKRVLQVSIPRNTKVLEIAVTLPDPKKAHALAQYLAEEAVRLNRKTNRAGDDEVIGETRGRVEQAVARTKAAQAARAAAAGRARQDRDSLEAAVQSAWWAQEEQERRLRELEATAGYRGERLTLLDPGVTPERPSSPNLPLNLAAALALSLVASWFYLTVEFGWRQRRTDAPRPALRVASKN